MCQRCRNHVNHPGASPWDRNLRDLLAACREARSSKPLPRWLSKPPKMTLAQVAPMPAWLKQERSHGPNLVGTVEYLSNPYPVAIKPYPDMTPAQLRAELDRQYRRLSGKEETE